MYTENVIQTMRNRTLGDLMYTRVDVSIESELGLRLFTLDMRVKRNLRSFSGTKIRYVLYPSMFLKY